MSDTTSAEEELRPPVPVHHGGGRSGLGSLPDGVVRRQDPGIRRPNRFGERGQEPDQGQEAADRRYLSRNGSIRPVRAPDALPKRLMDMVGAVIALILCLPLLIVLGVAVRVTSRGPVVFRQVRLGIGGRPFHCLKLRSMVHDAEGLLEADEELFRLHRSNGFRLPTGHDPRVTPVGRLLRRTHLDELPQLWNVVRGDLSLVGPRPVEAEQYHDWVKADPEASDVLSVKPGIFGAWTVQGQNRVDDPARIRVELDYVRSRSLLGDLAILLRHLPVLARGQRSDRT